MNQSDKSVIMLRVGVTGKGIGTLLAGLAMANPVGLVVAGAGALIVYAGNKFISSEVESMERQRAEGKNPKLPRGI